MFLGLNRKASNHATRSEMGSFPLQIVIIGHILTYYYYLNSKDDSSIVKQALNIMHKNSSKIANSYISNINNILIFYNNRFSGKPDDITNSVIRETTTRLQNKYSEYWKSKICSSSRLEFFSKIKENFVEEPFLDEVKNYDVKRNFFKFRKSNHSLFIEIGRYCRPIFPREKRICKFCKNEIEDELYLLFKCSLYADLREIFFQKIARILDFNPDDQSNALNMMFTSTNRISKIHIANYIHKCLSRRKDIAMEI